MARLPDELPENRLTSAFERRVHAALEGAVITGEPLVVACSGGPDSVAALIAVRRVAPASPLTAAHFNHGLRPSAETEADASFVKALSTLIGVPVVLGAAGTQLGRDEASARHARYRWLERVLTESEAATLVTGHTQDDQAETVLLNLVRGAGLRGASGMSTVSAWPLGADGRLRRVFRPLLKLPRTAVEEYLAALDVEARLDPTNELSTYSRNRIRLEVVPHLEAINPRVRSHLAGFAERAAEAEAAIGQWAQLELAVGREGAVGHGCVERARLQELPDAVAKRVLTLAAAEVGLALDAGQQATLLRLASRQGAHLDLPGGAASTDDRLLKFVDRGG